MNYVEMHSIIYLKRNTQLPIFKISSASKWGKKKLSTKLWSKTAFFGYPKCEEFNGKSAICSILSESIH